MKDFGSILLLDFHSKLLILLCDLRKSIIQTRLSLAPWSFDDENFFAKIKNNSHLTKDPKYFLNQQFARNTVSVLRICQDLHEYLSATEIDQLPDCYPSALVWNLAKWLAIKSHIHRTTKQSKWVNSYSVRCGA